jgi:hypothetical protein
VARAATFSSPPVTTVLVWSQSTDAALASPSRQACAQPGRKERTALEASLLNPPVLLAVFLVPSPGLLGWPPSCRGALDARCLPCAFLPAPDSVCYLPPARQGALCFAGPPPFSAAAPLCRLSLSCRARAVHAAGCGRPVRRFLCFRSLCVSRAAVSARVAGRLCPLLAACGALFCAAACCLLLVLGGPPPFSVCLG